MSEMSDGRSQDPDPRRTRKEITAMLIMLGIVALLPGLCSVVFIRAHASNWLSGLGMLIGVGGVAMIGMGVARLFGARADSAVAPQPDERGCRTALLFLFGFVLLVALGVGFILAQLSHVRFH